MLKKYNLKITCKYLDNYTSKLFREIFYNFYESNYINDFTWTILFFICRKC